MDVNMGLDGVELILALEETFQISIPDDEVESVATVGDLHDLIVAKLNIQDSSQCLTSAAFYRTRRGITDTLGFNRREIRPSTSLEAILPRTGRRRSWQRIQDATRLKLPALQHTGRMQLTLLGVGVVFSTAIGIQLRFTLGWTLLSAFLGLFVGGILIKLTPRLAIAFPNHDATVGDLARDVLALNHARLVSDIGSWNKVDAWETLRRVIVMQTSIEPEKIHRDALIGNDLGID
jgi:hypothetical protein